MAGVERLAVPREVEGRLSFRNRSPPQSVASSNGHLSMKETGFTEVALRTAAKVFAAAGLLALLFWLGWVMIDVEHMNSGFTLP
mgnify:CR=1 FL=1